MNNGYPTSITCQFIARKWEEEPIEILVGAEKISRASIINVLTGDIEGESTLEYRLHYPAIAGDEVPFAGEEHIVGRIGLNKGSFILTHEGKFSPKNGVSGQLVIKAGSGTGDFEEIEGSGTIIAKAGEHVGTYALICVLPLHKSPGTVEIKTAAEDLFTPPSTIATTQQEIPKYNPEKHRKPLFSAGFVKGFGTMFIVVGVVSVIFPPHQFKEAVIIITMGLTFRGAGKSMQITAKAKQDIEYPDK